MDCNKVFTAFLVFGIIIKISAQGIIIPILVNYYESLFFILLFTSFQFLIFYGILYLILTIKNKKFQLPKEKLTIFLCGLFNALMSLLMIYSANPKRTPIIIQTILAGLPIIPSVIIRKFAIKKITIYKKRFIIPSLLCLLTSLGLSAIPLIGHWTPYAALWISLYFLGIVFQSAYNVMQEKYLFDTNDYSLHNKVIIVFYGFLIQFIIVASCFWLEFFIGDSKHPTKAFLNSLIMTFTDLKSGLLLEGFIVSYVIAFIMSVYLNAISSNYNMVIPSITNPIVALFFTIFPKFDPGLKFPLWIVILCIILSASSIILWVKGERKTDYVNVVDQV